MKKLVLAVLISFTFSQCTEQEKPTIQQELKTLSRSPETFIVQPDKNATLETKLGTKLTIPPNSFVHNDGSIVTDPIDIEIKEIFDISEMILNDVTTTSNGFPLISLGMVKIEARSNNNDLKIKTGRTLLLSIPNKTNTSEGKLFYGTRDDDVIDWEYAGNSNDTTVVVTTTIPLSYGKDSVSTTTYKYENGRQILISTDSGASIFNNSVDSSIPALYDFKISKLGWINCDIFLNIENPATISLTIENAVVIESYIILKELNSIIPLYFNNRMLQASNLPANLSVKIIVIGLKDEKLMWVKHDLVLDVSNELKLELTPISREALEKELRKLDM